MTTNATDCTPYYHAIYSYHIGESNYDIYGYVAFNFTVKPNDTNICHMVNKKHAIGLLPCGSIII